MGVPFRNTLDTGTPDPGRVTSKSGGGAMAPATTAKSRPCVPPLKLSAMSAMSPPTPKKQSLPAKKAMGMMSSLKQMMAGARRSTSGKDTSAATSAAGLPQQLRELAQLQAEGVLTESEFCAAKAKLLGTRCKELHQL